VSERGGREAEEEGGYRTKNKKPTRQCGEHIKTYQNINIFVPDEKEKHPPNSHRQATENSLDFDKRELLQWLGLWLFGCGPTPRQKGSPP